MYEGELKSSYNDVISTVEKNQRSSTALQLQTQENQNLMD